MTAAFDAYSVSGEYTAGSADPYTWTHTPSGTPRGIVIFDQQSGTSSDHVNGPVLYGGVATSRVLIAQDTAAEAAALVAYFLGSGIPTGPQTVSIDHDTGIFGTKHAICISLTGSGDLEVVASGKAENDQANPTVTLDSGTRTALKLFGLYSGQDAIASITNSAGMTRILAEKWTAGVFCRVYGYRTTPATGSETVLQTATSDDVAMIGLAISEVVAAAVAASYQLAKLANLPRLER
ncbi:MAG: hypothetical protein U0667_18390 [Chloroflexota bacterium]